MSQRSVIEINHDCSFQLDNTTPELFVRLLGRALASGSDESWAPLKRYGITRITQCHHSEDRKVVVGKDGMKREYPFG